MARKVKDDANGETKRRTKPAPIGDNGVNADVIKKYARRIGNLLDELESFKGAKMAEVNELYQECADVASVKLKLIKRGIKEERAEQKKAAWEAGLESDERETLDQVRHALGLLEGTPLGEFALKRSESEEADAGASE